METGRQRFARLVTALEDLASQEAGCARSRDFESLKEVQQRAGEIVAALLEHSTERVDPAVRERLAAVVKQREATAAEIQIELDVTKAKLDSLQVSQRRAAQVAPVYGGGGIKSRQSSGFTACKA